MSTGNPTLDRILQENAAIQQQKNPQRGNCQICGGTTAPGSKFCGQCLAAGGVKGRGAKGQRPSRHFWPQTTGMRMALPLQIIFYVVVITSMPVGFLGALALSLFFLPEQFLYVGHVALKEAKGLLIAGVGALGLGAVGLVGMTGKGLWSLGKKAFGREKVQHQVSTTGKSAIEIAMAGLPEVSPPGSSSDFGAAAPKLPGVSEIPGGSLDMEVQTAAALDDDTFAPSYQQMQQEIAGLPQDTVVAIEAARASKVTTPTRVLVPAPAPKEEDLESASLTQAALAEGLLYDRNIRVNGPTGVPRPGYRLRVFGGEKPVVMWSQTKDGLDLTDSRVEIMAARRGVGVLEHYGLTEADPSFIEHCPASASLFGQETFTEVEFKKRLGKTPRAEHTPVEKGDVEARCGVVLKGKVADKGREITL